MDSMKMQTLQIYKRVEKIPLDEQIKRIRNELNVIRKEHPTSMFLQLPPPEILKEVPTVKTIELQNILTRLEKELSFWVNDYRMLIDELREADRIQPKTEHDEIESDEKAQENVDKIIKVENIKEQLLNEFNDLCIQFEENDSKLRRRNRQLETLLMGAQSKIENLEYELTRKLNYTKINNSEPQYKFMSLRNFFKK